ncbi:hypothetical protein OC835_002555 [Tilletia horrida]|nr:hypothetical protein OC835_002555 [Tilletia horrida]
MSILADADWVTHSLRVGYLRYVDDHYARQVIEFPFEGSHGLDFKTGDPGLGMAVDAQNARGPRSLPYHSGFPADNAGPSDALGAVPSATVRLNAGQPRGLPNNLTPYPAGIPSTSASAQLASTATGQDAGATVELPRPNAAQPFTQADLLQPRSRSRPRARSRPSGASFSGSQMSGTTAVDPAITVTSSSTTAAPPIPGEKPSSKSNSSSSTQPAGKSGIAEEEPPPPLLFEKLPLKEVRARSQQERPQVSAIAASLQAESDAAANPFATLYRDVCGRNASATASPAPPSPAPSAPAAPNVGRVRHGPSAGAIVGRSFGGIRGRMPMGGGPGGKRPGGPGRIEVYFPFANKAANAKLPPPSPTSSSSKSGPLALNARAGSMTLSVRVEAKMEEVIGYALYCYVDAKWSPSLTEIKDWAQGDQDEIKLTTLGYCLRIVDDGEVDDDFPALDRSLAVGKFGGDEFAVCQASPSQIKENEVASAPYRASRKAALAASLKAASKAAAKTQDTAASADLLSPSAAVTISAGSVTPQLTGNLAAITAGKLSSATQGGGNALLSVPGAVGPGTSANSATPVNTAGGMTTSVTPTPNAAGSTLNPGGGGGGGIAGGGAAAAAMTAATTTPLSSSVNVSRSFMASGLAAAGAGAGGQQLEATVFLRVLHMAKQNVDVKILIQVPASMYFADVLDLICRKVQEENPQEWALLAPYGGQDVVVPLNRTVESLDEACDLKLVKRDTLAERGAIGRLTAPGGNPNTSIFASRNKSSQQDSASALDMSAYKSWKVIRAARSARMFSKPERLLTLDGEWIWIEPSDTRQFSARPTSFHISAVVACKQSTKGGAAFKLVVRRQPSLADTTTTGGSSSAAAAGVGRDTKRYDLEAESANDAEEIVHEILKVIARRQQSGAEQEFVGMRSISISVFATWLLLCCVAAVLVGGSRPVEYPDLLNAQISDLRRGLERGHWTSVDLVKAYLARIDEVNHKGPKLNAVTEVASTALAQAREADRQRRHGHVKGSLHGIPIIVKDNVATHVSLGMNTTAGSFSLVGSVPPADAFVAANLRAAGALLIGKASLSVWAYYRGSNLTEGWSPRGGFVTSAWYPGASACSSSAGSGVIASIGLAAATLGTETDGSIICPSNFNGVVGIKPTVRAERQEGVIPLAASQDSPGPIVNSVSNAAEVLTAMLGESGQDYTRVLRRSGLRGKRVGVLYGKFTNATYQGFDPSVVGLYNRALRIMEAQGAVLVNASIPSVDSNEYDESTAETIILNHELKANMRTYLGKLKKVPTGVRSLKDLIAYANANPSLELPGKENTQDLFEDAERTDGLRNATYLAAKRKNRRLGATEGIDAALAKYKVDVLVAPSSSYLYSVAAIVGYPALSVPMGYMRAEAQPDDFNDPPFPFPHAPAGLTFVASADQEATLLQLGYAYEQASKERVKRTPQFAPKTQIRDVQTKL